MSSSEYSFEIGFFENLLEHLPEDLQVVETLGEMYTKVGRHEDGLKMDLRAVELAPERPVARYNLGCSLALLSDKEGALEALTKAVDLGYEDAEWMQKDEDLLSLHGNSDFEFLIERIKAARGS